MALPGSMPLGWIKGLKNRINNYFPREWRILMELEGKDLPSF
ncbi:MAG: hypothetical protein H6559_02045 [Lewinellaceae bacterium]|nr:hypothetical protein [Lewinellaceae bacterium]